MAKDKHIKHVSFIRMMMMMTIFPLYYYIFVAYMVVGRDCCDCSGLVKGVAGF